MRQISPLAYAIFISLLPLSAMAEVNCSVFDAIERIQFAQARLSSAADGSLQSADANLIIGESSRLDVERISISHDQKLSLQDAATLVTYIEDAQQLAAFLKNQQESAIQTYFNRPAFAQQQEKLSRILPRLKCNPLSHQGDSNGTQRVASSIKQENGARKITFTGTATLLASVILFLAVGARIYAIGVAWRNRKKRRSKRFHCYIETQINYGHITRRAVILDISCNGAKIQVDLEDEETETEVWIINAWHKAKVSWHNPHYLGVRFDTPLRSAFVETICSHRT